MKNVIYLWKPVGLTPLEIVEKFKENNMKYKNEIISYAGRLDPMAEGILVLLIGEENKNREDYLSQKKEYESEIIFGIATDTFDSLGLITDSNFKIISKQEIEKSLNTFLGKQKQIYPPFSSKAVNGKPLFWWARNKKLNEIKIPEREIEIYNIELLNFEKIIVKELIEKIINQIKNVNGDFRQDQIIKSWKEFEKLNREKELLKIKIRVYASSGTYMRRIADELGKKFDSKAFASSIKRIRIGEVSKEDCVKII